MVRWILLRPLKAAFLEVCKVFSCKLENRKLHKIALQTTEEHWFNCMFDSWKYGYHA